MAILVLIGLAPATWGSSDTPPLSSPATPAAPAESSVAPADWTDLFDRAKAGDTESLVEIGDRLHAGRGVRADPVKAMEYWTHAALRGHAGAKRRIALMLLEGRVVPAHPEKAMALLRQAAEQSDLDSVRMLADRYASGRDVERDAAEAVRWLKVGADLGDLDCRMRLAWHLENGSGIARDREAAWELYRACAMQDHAPAWNRMGILHADGLGVRKDPVEAYRCFARADRLGLKEAARNMSAVESRASFLERRRMRAIAAEIPGPASVPGQSEPGEP
ncbi:MAG: sel1 repeat family protein [Kiritimatiellae bacterium]|nr:sel1 repeat family protein [Kiritimatiellia bacterium]